MNKIKVGQKFGKIMQLNNLIHPLDNWFEDLKEIDKKDKIIHISIRNNWFYCGNPMTEKQKFLNKDYKVIREFSSIDDARAYLDYDFDGGSGGIAEGPNFTAWSKENIYFSNSAEGMELIDTLPRNPCKKVHSHL
jgi:hypothetical protein